MKRTLLTALTLFSTLALGSAVDDRFIQLRSNTSIRARNAADTGVVNLLKADPADSVVLANALSVDSSGAVSLSSSPLTLANLSSDPGTASTGDVYFNSVSNKIKFYNGSSWVTIEDTDTGITALTGDVTASGSGTQAASVVRIQSIPVSASAPTSGQILKYNGSQWAPGTDLGITALTSDVTASGVGSQAATVVKIQGRSVSSSAPSANQYLKWNSVSTTWEPVTVPSGVSGAVQFSDGSGNFSSDAANFFWDDTNNRLGLGTNAPAYTFDSTGQARNLGHMAIGNNAVVDANSMLNFLTYSSNLVIDETSTVNNKDEVDATTISLNYNPATDALTTGVSGVDVNVEVDASNAQHLAFMNAVNSVVATFGSGLIDTQMSVLVGAGNQGTGTITDNYGIYLNNGNIGGGVITNNYGLYIDNIQGTNTWGIYQNDATAKNYFAGNVGIKTATPGSALDVKGEVRLSGATSGYVGLSSTATPTSYSLVLPAAQGAAGKTLSNDGSGNLSWVTPASSTWASTKAYSTDTFSSDNSVSLATAISYPSGGTGSDAFRYIATDDNDGTVGDGSVASLNIQSGSYTGMGAFTSIPGGDLNLFAGANHQTGAPLGQVTGGNLNLFAGTAVGSGDGGQITINGGLASHGGNGNGGGVIIAGGSPAGTGQIGPITLTSSVTQMNSPSMILPTATSDAAAGAQGWFYYNTSTNQVRIHDASVWKDFGAAPTGDPNTVAFFDGSGNLTDSVSFAWDGSALTVPGAIGFLNSGFQVSFVAPTLAASTAYILPAADGGSGDVLSTDGGGNLSWIPQSGGTPTGDPNTMSFFDGGGALTDQVDFTWDGSTLQTPGNIMPEATGTRNIGSSSVEYLASWGRAFKGITNVLVQAVSGTATIQGSTAVTLSNGTNNVSFTGTSFNPSVNNAISLGGAANNIFSLMRARNFGAGDGTSTLLQMDGTAGQTFPGGQSISAALRNSSNTGTHIGIFSANNATANTVATGNMYIGTGNKTAGNANSGDMILRVGTPFGTGVRGTLAFQNGSEGTAHYLWGSTDTTGKGAWVGSLQDAASVVSVDYLSRQLNDSSAVKAIDYEARQMFDSSGNASEDFTARTLYTSGVQPSVDWENHIDFDNGGQNSLTWDARQFTASDGSTVVLDYSNPAGVNLNSTVITNPAGGTVTVPSLAGTLNVVDARVTTSSLVVAEVIQNDVTAKIANVVPNAGSFDINMQAAPTLNTSVRYVIFENPN